MIIRTDLLWTLLASALLLARNGVHAAISIDVNDVDSIKSAASTAAYDMMTYYSGNQSGQIPGKLADTWWEGGALFMTLIQYWHYTGDTTYNDEVSVGMQWQAGEGADYMPSNWSSYLGNDDQVFWGLAAITAAELKYPDVPDKPSWLALAQAVFNTQAVRWDTTACGGGLRWQLYPYQAGYTTKNSVSNGGFFQLAARLAVFTGNQTYADWAVKMWNWSTTSPLVNKNTWHVGDTTSMESNCTDLGNIQWTYNYGIYMMGAAYMYNFTNGDPQWSAAVGGLLNVSFSTFFPSKYGGNTMSEVACEVNMKCDRNQDCFKGFLSLWMAFTTYLVPWTKDLIIPKLQGSANAAAKQCSGGNGGTFCGRRWWQSTWDGTQSLEEQMSATSIFTANLFDKTGGGPVTSKTGGTSASNPGVGGAGSNSDQGNPTVLKPITTGDKAGAGILTALVLGSLLGTSFWLVK